MGVKYPVASMKKHDFITVLGTNSIQMSVGRLREWGPIVTVSNKKLPLKHIDYVWTRDENHVLWYLQQRPAPVQCVTTPALYSKYVFYDYVHSFPPLNPQFNLQLDTNTNDQTYALLSAIGLCNKKVMLVGYNIQDLKVLKDLRQIIMLHPEMNFYFLCNPPKTKQLEFCENAECVLFKDMGRLKDG